MQTKFTLVVLAVVAALSQAFVPSANSRWAARTQSRHAERVAPRAMLVMSEVEGKLKEIVAGNSAWGSLGPPANRGAAPTRLTW